MGRFERLVSTPTLIELFKEKYHIPQEGVVRHCTTEGVEFDRKVGEVVIPMIAFIEGGMTIPMGRITCVIPHIILFEVIIILLFKNKIK